MLKSLPTTALFQECLAVSSNTAEENGWAPLPRISMNKKPRAAKARGHFLKITKLEIVP